MIATTRLANGVGVLAPVPVVVESNILPSRKREGHAARLVIHPNQEVATLTAVLSTASGGLGGAGAHALVPVVEEHLPEVEITAQEPVVGVAGVGDHRLTKG